MMKRYEKYKPSGIEWIGAIPEHWKPDKLKWICRFEYGESLSVMDREDGDFPVYGSNGITGFHASAISKAPSIIVGRKGSFGKINWSDKECFPIDTTYFIDERMTDKDLRWLYYVLQNLGLDTISKDTGVPGLNREDAYQNIIPIPSLDEQTAIASYLNKKTAQIDSLIEKKQKLIELLKEERTAIINHAVTKGINPKVKLKASGIEWLGDIPEHWEVKKLKYVANVVLGKMLTNEDKGGYHLKSYLRAANLQWLDVDVSDAKEMWFSTNELHKLRLKKHDLLVSEGGEVGRTCIWNEELDECYIQNSVHKITILHPNEPNYFLYLFYSYGQRGFFDSIVNRISIAHLTGDKIKEILIIIPPAEEQRDIVHYIESHTSRIDATITKIEKEIELMQEYRTALISEVVTGKIKVI